VAEEVTSQDNLLFRVKLRRAWTFSNGELVTARSFVNAWNFAADPAKAQLHGDAFRGIVGYAAMRGLPEPVPTPLPTASATGPASASGTTAPTGTASTSAPTAGATTGPPTPSTAATATTTARPTTMSGLTVVDDLTFTIRLVSPDVTFRDRLATLPFAPVPSATLSDPAAFALAPIGNGPYVLAGGWTEGVEVRLVPYVSYPGSDPARNAGLVFRFSKDPSLTYPQLLAGTLDVLDTIPVTALGQYKADLKSRGTNQPVGATQSLLLPLYQPQWSTPDGRLLRLALSRAIDRKGLSTTLFAGTRSPAGDLAAPVVAGHSPDLCGDACAYDPAAAALAWSSVRTAPKTLEIAYGADAGGRPVVEAMCAQIVSALSIGCTPRPYPRQSVLDAEIAAKKLTVPALVTWRMDRPDLGGFLSPRFLAGSSANPSGYAGFAAQALLAKAVTQTDTDARTSTYREAGKEILADLPVVPLWYLNACGGSSDKLAAVKTDVFGVPVYTELTRP